MFIEILFKMLLFKGGVLIYAEHCIFNLILLPSPVFDCSKKGPCVQIAREEEMFCKTIVKKKIFPPTIFPLLCPHRDSYNCLYVIQSKKYRKILNDLLVEMIS